jgi:hypothetical protein
MITIKGKNKTTMLGKPMLIVKKNCKNITLILKKGIVGN